VSGLGPAGLRIIQSTATVLGNMSFESYRAGIAEKYPRNLMKLRVSEGTVHRRPGVEAAFRYLNKDAPKKEEWDWTGIAPGNPNLKTILKQCVERVIKTKGGER